ncbi:MAG: hypothetical protein WC565_09465 [Parcubacteria group bacterium]|jgi:hypothetical protein
MKCKQCGREHVATNPGPAVFETPTVLRFVEVDCICTEIASGYPATFVEQPVDGGVFCSAECLIGYLAAREAE